MTCSKSLLSLSFHSFTGCLIISERGVRLFSGVILENAHPVFTCIPGLIKQYQVSLLYLQGLQDL